MADSKKYNGSTWEHSLRKLTTDTEAIESPLYSDGTAITSYTIKGNMSQTGIPTPGNPVDVNGVGVRTENLLDSVNFEEKCIVTRCTKSATETGLILTATGNDPYVNTVVANGQATPTQYYEACISVKPSTDYILSANKFPKCYISYLNDNYVAVTGYSAISENTSSFAFTTASNCTKIIVRLGANIQTGETVEFSNLMLIEGSTAPTSYIPYGYKIPILSGGVTTNIYLGSTQTVRQVKKFVLTGQENYTYIGGSSGPFRIEIDGLAAFSTDKCDWLCSHFPSLSYSQWAQSGGSYSAFLSRHNTDAQKYLRFKDVAYSTLADFIAWISAQYANGTPVCVWYVLATPRTAAVNEPLMKIGDYADTLSNATSIPTTEGANSITVDTTVQPSEFTATWTGWHDANVKEWDGSQWQ